MRRVVILPLLRDLAACAGGSKSPSSKGSASDSAATQASETPSPEPTDSRGKLGVFLDEAAAAEETWLSDHDTYTSSTADLTTAGLTARPGFTLTAKAEGADLYCLLAKAPDGTVRAYVNSLGPDAYEGYLYDKDVCTSHSAGKAFPSHSPSPAPTGRAAVETALENAATAEETYYTDYQKYVTDLATLTAAGYEALKSVTVTAKLVGADAYCLTGVGQGSTLHYASDDAEVKDGPCP
jgi:hypothetical protein